MGPDSCNAGLMDFAMSREDNVSSINLECLSAFSSWVSLEDYPGRLRSGVSIVLAPGYLEHTSPLGSRPATALLSSGVSPLARDGGLRFSPAGIVFALMPIALFYRVDMWFARLQPRTACNVACAIDQGPYPGAERVG